MPERFIPVDIGDERFFDPVTGGDLRKIPRSKGGYGPEEQPTKMGKFTLTYSNTIPKGEGKFGSFEKLEIAREFDDSVIPEAAAANLLKAFVHQQLGLTQQSEAEVERAFVEINHWWADRDREVAMIQNRPVGQPPQVANGKEFREDQLRLWLVDMGFDLDEILQAQMRATKERP